MQMNLRIDGIIQLFDVLESLMERLLQRTLSMIKESLIIDGESVQKSFIRPFNLSLEAFSSN